MNLVYRAPAAFFAMIVPECPTVGNSCVEHGPMARDVCAHLVGMHAMPQTTIAPSARASDGSGAAETAFAAARRRSPHLPGPQSRLPAWLESHQRVARLDGRLQTPDLVPPSGDEAVELGVLAVVPHTALAERELMLRIY
jgi:hypothetical protein